MLHRYSLILVVLLCSMPGLELHRSGLPVARAASPGALPQATRAPSSDFIKSLQRELKRAGYDPGTADGRIGPTTRRALRRFQAAHGLPATGAPDIATLTKLLGKDLRG